ncbi:MAG TPA: hypothetical protein VE691_12940, partial [Rubrobacter sp.]|nr:hypothetical protein [Rubrobacter sp.]
MADLRRKPLPRTSVNKERGRAERREVYIEYMCDKNIVARTYNHGGTTVATIANIDKTALTAHE